MKKETKQTKYYFKELFSLAAPIILSQLFQVAYQFTDSFWVGRLGGGAVASVSLSMPLIYFMTSLGIGLAVAGSTLTAQFFGAKNKKMLGKAAAQTMLMVCSISLVMSLIGWLLAPTLLRLMGAEQNIMPDALSYLRIAFLGLIFNFCFFVFQSIMRSVGRAKIPFFIVIGGVLLNFALDPLFMFGAGFIPSLGVKGVALATIFTQSLASIAGLIILFSGKHGIKVASQDFLPDFSFIQRSLKLGIAPSVEQSARSLALSVITGLVAGFGTMAVAAYGAGANIFNLLLMISFGFSGANSALVGQKLGAGDQKGAKKMAQTSLLATSLIVGALGFSSAALAPHLISFFVPGETEVIAKGAAYLSIVASFFFLTNIQIICAGSLQASGNMKIPMIFTITAQWILQIPLIILFSRVFDFGLKGVWLAFPITNFIAATAYLFTFFRSGWEKKTLISQEERLAEKVAEEAEWDTASPLGS